jgi:hypothetical protein
MVPSQDQQQLRSYSPAATLVRDYTTKDYGCVWDGPNYSCAFDSAFMVTFSAYRYADPPWRHQWRTSSDFNGTLAGFFDHILTATQIPMLRRQLPSLFNMYRDRVRDDLNAIDAVRFPRFGQNVVAASEIFDRMCNFEGTRRSVCLRFTCDNEGHQPRTKERDLTYALIVHNPPPVEDGFAERPTLQQWLSSYINELRTNPPPCYTCSVPCSGSSLSIAPLPWIWIDIPHGGDQRFTLSTALALEQDSRPSVGYTLTGIIYVGGAHFSARWRGTAGQWWAYDGMVNSGRPLLDAIVDDVQLTNLGSRVMHILFYRLDSAIITGYA